MWFFLDMSVLSYIFVTSWYVGDNNYPSFRSTVFSLFGPLTLSITKKKREKKKYCTSNTLFLILSNIYSFIEWNLCTSHILCWIYFQSVKFTWISLNKKVNIEESVKKKLYPYHFSMYYSLFFLIKKLNFFKTIYDGGPSSI
jgi:hypothetical protein